MKMVSRNAHKISFLFSVYLKRNVVYSLLEPKPKASLRIKQFSDSEHHLHFVCQPFIYFFFFMEQSKYYYVTAFNQLFSYTTVERFIFKNMKTLYTFLVHFLNLKQETKLNSILVFVANKRLNVFPYTYWNKLGIYWVLSICTIVFVKNEFLCGENIWNER